MKKLLLLFLATVAFIGCSSDDNNETPVVKENLVLSTSQSKITVGEKLKFNVVDKAGKTVNAGIYVDNVGVVNPVTFDKAGTFSVVAKKDGFKDSNVLKIEVTDVGDVKVIQLQLKATASSVNIGDQVKFTISADNAAVDGAVVVNVNTGAVVIDNTFDATDIGEFKFVAKKNGFADSAEITVNVEAKGKANGYYVNGLEVDIELVILDLIQVNTMDANGKAIVVDKIVELEDGRLANEYVLMPLEQNNYTFLTLWVVNNSIVKKDGVIVDYGKRILPTEVNKETDIVFGDLFLVGADFFIMENNLTVESFVLNFDKLNVPNKGVGVGESGVKADISIGFDFESDQNNIEFNYSGDIQFTESIEKDSKAFKARNSK